MGWKDPLIGKSSITMVVWSPFKNILNKSWKSNWSIHGCLVFGWVTELGIILSLWRYFSYLTYSQEQIGDNKYYLFSQLCTIPEGQEYRKKLSDFQTSNMIKFAATPADVRKEKILDAVRSMNFGQDPYMKEFGISVDTSMAKVRGKKFRHLLPRLSINNNKCL